MSDDRTVVTTAERDDDVREVLYGLQLRGLRAEARPVASKSGHWEIVVPANQSETALRVILDVWDAVLDFDTAVTPQGTCPFCGYEVLGLPRTPSGGLLCPECGVDLRSADARKAVRDGRTPRSRRRI